MEFYRRRLWLRIEPEEMLGVMLPDGSDLMIGSIMGQGAEEYGLTFFRGPNAASLFIRLIDGEDVIDEIDQIGFSVCALSEIPKECRPILDQARFKGRRETLAPWFVSKLPGKWSRGPKRADQRALLFAINGLLEADDKGQLKPFDIRDGRILSFKLEGNAFEPIVKPSIRVVSQAEASDGDQPETELDEIEDDLSLQDGQWVAGTLPIPIPIGDDDSHRYCVMVADRFGEEAKKTGLVAPNAPAEIANFVIAVMNGENDVGWRGLPKSILFTSQRAFALMAPVLKERGVESEFSPSDPKLESLTEVVIEAIARLSEATAEEMETKEPRLSDYDLWRDRDNMVTEFLFEQLRRSRRSTEKPERKYFGNSGRIADATEISLELIAFWEWLFMQFRPTKKSKTIAEVVLSKADSFPKFTMDILRARSTAGHSFYRVEEVETGESITLIDTINGQRHLVHDRSFSLAAEIDMQFAARIYSAGPYFFICVASPPTRGMMLDSIVHRLTLSDEDLEEVLASAPERLGRTWDWLEEERSYQATHPPKLQNFHGEPLCPTRLVYEVTDSKAATAALTARADIDYDHDNQMAHWLLKAKSMGPDGKVTGAKIEFIGDQWLVEVNSLERSATIRDCLDGLPGVRFLHSKTIDMDEVPLDDALPSLDEGLSDEVVNQILQQAIDEHYRNWIDIPLPALSGKTPRQASETAKGKKKVRQLILSMSSNPAPGGKHISPPRDWMLEELGM